MKWVLALFKHRNNDGLFPDRRALSKKQNGFVQGKEGFLGFSGLSFIVQLSLYASVILDLCLFFYTCFVLLKYCNVAFQR